MWCLPWWRAGSSSLSRGPPPACRRRGPPAPPARPARCKSPPHRTSCHWCAPCRWLRGSMMGPSTYFVSRTGRRQLWTWHMQQADTPAGRLLAAHEADAHKVPYVMLRLHCYSSVGQAVLRSPSYMRWAASASGHLTAFDSTCMRHKSQPLYEPRLHSTPGVPWIVHTAHRPCGGKCQPVLNRSHSGQSKLHQMTLTLCTPPY